MTASTNTPPTEQPLAGKRVAVVGAGITGLSAAWLLDVHSPHHVTVYEADGELGGHAHTVDFQRPGYAACPVDVGFIIYNEVTYPNLIRLFEHWQVSTDCTEMSFGITRNGGELEWASHGFGSLFCQPWSMFRLDIWRMMYDIIRFNWEFTRFATDTRLTDEQRNATIDEWLAGEGYSDAFIQNYLMPTVAAVWSTPADTCQQNFSAWALARFFHNHRLLQLIDRPQWRTVAGGSREYVGRVAKQLKDVRLSSRVTLVRRTKDGRVEVVDSAGHSDHYDHVLFACHADQALQLLGDDADVNERSVLEQFKFVRNRVVLHWDEQVMPICKKAWASWNYYTTRGKGNDTQLSLTYWMNRIQNLDIERHGPIFVSVNPPAQLATDKIIGEWSLDHPLYSNQVVKAQQQLAQLPSEQLSFCGAWTRYGFHEDGARSGLLAAQALGAQAPFAISDAEYDDFWSRSSFWVLLGWLWTLFDTVLRAWPQRLLAVHKHATPATSSKQD